MITIDVNLPIGNEQENRWWAKWDGKDIVFSLDTVRNIFESNPDETDFKFNFDCDGGMVDEGFKIYDYIRTSGKNIHCNIVGGCHSMAIVMLLAAPAEQRTANQHATSLIHCVRGDFFSRDGMTADEMRAAADEIQQLENQIIDIYVDRTGCDRDEMVALMKEEKVRDAEWLMNHGFVHALNQYNTNRRRTATPTKANKSTKNINQPKSNDMAKSLKEALNMATDWLKKATNLTAMNFDHEDADGNVMFSTDAEDDHLEVGMAATPDGTYTLAVETDGHPVGTTVVVADGAITEINDPETDPDEDSEEVENLRAENARLSALVDDAASVINELKGQLAGNYKPANAKRTTPAKTPKVDHKDEMREKLGIGKK